MVIVKGQGGWEGGPMLSLKKKRMLLQTVLKKRGGGGGDSYIIYERTVLYA